MSAEVNNNGRCVCAECGVVVAVPQLAAHMRRHLGYRPYACSRCAYAAYTEADVHDHARRCGSSLDQFSSTILLCRSHADQSTSVRYNANQENEQTIAQMIDKVRMQVRTSTRLLIHTSSSTDEPSSRQCSQVYIPACVICRART